MRKDFEEYLNGLRASAENEEVSRAMRPDRGPRSQSAVELRPDYYQRQAEIAGRSEWSGGMAGGGTWGGRSR
jgi:hypothetical protein